MCVLLIGCVLGTVPTVARADDPPYEPVIVPKCTLYRVGDKDVCGYSFEEWKLVLLADAELVSTRKLLAKEKEKNSSLFLQVGDLKNVIDVYSGSQVLLITNNNKLTQDIIDLDKKYQDERVKPRLGSPLAWTITAAIGAMFGGYLLKDRF